MGRSQFNDEKNYAAITGAYWGFTLTDGALRMLVLLHFHALGFSPIDLALMFLLYEAMGVLTNFIGGWIGAKHGLKLTLFTGLMVQIGALIMLSGVQPHWVLGISVIYVMTAQAFSGIAKDLTKMSAKSAVKLVVPDGNQGLLFRWVARLTGSKNALKGVGFLLGSVLLQFLGFHVALWSMAVLLGFVLLACTLSLPAGLGVSASSKTVRELFAKSKGVNILAAARIFMFGARDVWFVVGLPVFLYSAGWTFWEVGGFLAVWTIAYGVIQAIAPSLVRKSKDGLSREVPAARLWGLILVAVPAMLIGLLEFGDVLPVSPQMIVVAGLTIFGLPFAVNSSLHSYLILAYAGSKKAAEDVGFYYAANAAGRLMGTLLSGALYQAGGLIVCLLGSFIMLSVCSVISLALPKRSVSHGPADVDR